MYCAVAKVQSFKLNDNMIDDCKYVATDFMLAGEGEFNCDSPRQLFSQLRGDDYLSSYSKGKVSMEDHGDYVTIQDKDTLHPLYILFHKDTQPVEQLPEHSLSIEKIINEELLNIAKLANIDVEDIIQEHGLDDMVDDDEWGDEGDDEEW